MAVKTIKIYLTVVGIHKKWLLRLINQIPVKCIIKPRLCTFKCRFKCHRNICFIVIWWAKFTIVRNCCLGIFMTFMTNVTCNGSLSWYWIFSDNDHHVHIVLAFCKVSCSLIPRWFMTVPGFIWTKGWYAPLAYSFRIWSPSEYVLSFWQRQWGWGLNNALACTN